MWVLEQVDRLPLATRKHLEMMGSGDPSAPKSATLNATCSKLVIDADGSAPKLLKVNEPGGDVGYVLTRAGAALLERSPSMRPPKHRSPDEWWRESVVSIGDKIRAHTRLTTDLAVLLRPEGTVETEFEARRRRPSQVFQPDRYEQETLTRRPDLMVQAASNLWAVEIERSEKGGYESGDSRYVDLVVKHAAGRFQLGGPMTEVTGVWYVVNDRRDAVGAQRSKVADAVVRGVFDGAEQSTGDLLVVVDPLPLDEIAACKFLHREPRGLPRVEVTVGCQAAGAVCGVMMVSYSMGVNRPRRAWRRRRW
jgi:hypothetical protein